MEEKIKAKIMDDKKMKRTFLRLAMEILERNREAENLVLIGIQTKGVFVARRIQQLIKELENIDIPLGILDITMFRDDLHKHEQQPAVKKTRIDFSIEDRDIILIDDARCFGAKEYPAFPSIDWVKGWSQKENFNSFSVENDIILIFNTSVDKRK